MGDLNQKIYEKAIQLLSNRMHTTGELLDKLKKRKFPEKEIWPVLKHLEELKFLDDERFAQIFVENMKLYRDWGYFGIKAKLIKKRVPNDLAEAALGDFFTLEDELVVAERFLGKLKKRGRSEYEQIMRSMSSKGFRMDVIQKLVK
jgi:regulatory protein